MDDTQAPAASSAPPHDLLARLEEVDPADAPDIAERLATELSAELDGPAPAVEPGR